MPKKVPMSSFVEKLLRAGKGRELVKAVLLARQQGKRTVEITHEGETKRFRAVGGVQFVK